MISHKYEDYADRLGIHILDALTAVLLWPAVVVVALWAWRGVPTIYGATSEGLPALAFVVAMMAAGACVAELVGQKLTWYNFPFALDDPRRALAYPVGIDLVKLATLLLATFSWMLSALIYVPMLKAYVFLALAIPIAVVALGTVRYFRYLAQLMRSGDPRR